MRNMFNIRKIILFKTIMQEITLSFKREDDGNNNNQYKGNKLSDNQFSRNQQSDKVRHFNKLKKNNKSKNYLNTQTGNKRTYAKMKNEKNNCCFKCHKLKYFHRDCSKKNK